MDGFLAAKASALNLNLRTDDVYGWDDFINVIRGADSTPSRIAGALTFRGKIEGPARRADFQRTFAGDGRAVR